MTQYSAGKQEDDSEVLQQLQALAQREAVAETPPDTQWADALPDDQLPAVEDETAVTFIDKT